MPSPFPGMDPYIEGQMWRDLHADLLHEIKNQLVPQLRPKYVPRIELRIYVEADDDEAAERIEPDVTIYQQAVQGALEISASASATPVLLALPRQREARERFLAIRETESQKIVAVLELLSPSNKRAKSEGRLAYLEKRNETLQSKVHLIELDLLRGGQRMPMARPLPPGDYYALVARADRRPYAEVYAWGLRQPLPIIAIPLANSDPDARLDLAAALKKTYDEGAYDYALDYTAAVNPSLSSDDAAWVAEQLERRSGT